MKVLSLFDGISCGMAALERAGIPVERYAAYEIDKYAIQISKKNYPQIEQCGDVTTADFTKYKGFDLLIGGSPCTYWSIAKNNRETTPDGIGGQLFMQYVRALKESECKYFLYENNYSIHKNIKDFISEKLGVDPIMINSALVSAQSRKRCYWTNIPNVTQPEDKGIVLADVIESGIAWEEKAYAYTTRCCAATFKDTLERHRHTMVAEPVIFQRGHGYNKGGIKAEKSPTLTSQGSWQHNNFVAEPIINDENGKSCTIKAQHQRTSIANAGRSDGYGATMVAEPIRIGTIHHGGNKDYDSKQWGVYSVKGKYVTLCGQGGGAGAKTGLYKIDLPDGDYIIRKLTPIEAERLQTLPDNYTEGISNTQRYKCIGNGWTVDVIASILGNIYDNTELLKGGD